MQFSGFLLNTISQNSLFDIDQNVTEVYFLCLVNLDKQNVLQPQSEQQKYTEGSQPPFYSLITGINEK